MSHEVAPLRLKREKAVLPPPAQAKKDPIASVLVDTGLPHVDDEFDFLIPEELSQYIFPGSLVSITFNRKRTFGVVISRKENSNFHGKLRFISEVIKKYPVVTDSNLELAAEVKKYYGGTRWDVLRFAIPRLTKKTVEKDFSAHNAEEIVNTSVNQLAVDDRYPSGFWNALKQNPKTSQPVRVYWSPPPSEDPFIFIEKLLAIGHKKIILLLPDRADVDRMVDLLGKNGNSFAEKITVWHSELTRKEREESFVEVLLGKKQIVIGVRSAVLLPMIDVDLIIVWEEGSDTYSEQRSPYYHAREVAIMRAHIDKSHLILAGAAPSLVATQYITQKYLTFLSTRSEVIKDQMPTVRAITNRAAPEQSGRVPTIAWQSLQRGLKAGPVIIQVPLRGYVLNLTCSRCLNTAICPCGGKLIFKNSQRIPECFLCGNLIHNWTCTFCESRQLRNTIVGDEKVLEEIGRAFPNTVIISSNMQHRIYHIDNEPAIIVATPGSEPIAERGYAAGLILNGNVTLQRAALCAEEDTRRRWFGLAMMLRPKSELFIDVDYGNRNLQALVRWDGFGASQRELMERQTLNLPPIAKSIQVLGEYQAVNSVVRNLPGHVLVSAPKMGVNGETEAVLRIPFDETHLVTEEIFRRVRQQSAKGEHVARVKIDPVAL